MSVPQAAAAGPEPAPERSIEDHFADVPLFMRELGEDSQNDAIQALQSLAHDGTPDGASLSAPPLPSGHS